MPRQAKGRTGSADSSKKVDRRHLTEEQRREVAVALRQDGHSLRAIAGALGTSKDTVARDLEGTVSPETVQGLDGTSRNRVSRFITESRDEWRFADVPLRRDQVTTPEDLLEFLDIEDEPRDDQEARITAWVAEDQPDPESLLMYLLNHEGWL